MKRLLALVVVLACAAALFFALDPRKREVRPEPAVRSSLAVRARQLEALPDSEAIAQRSIAPGSETTPRPPTAEVSDAPAAFDVRVVVLSRGERLPQAALPVSLTWWAGEKTAPSAQGTTDSAGAVQLRLETGGVPREPLCSISVGAGEGARRFNALPLQSELVVLLNTCTRLRGRVVFTGIETLERAWVQADEPARGMMTCPVMLGRAQALADGTFEIEACPSREVPWVDVSVQVASVAATRKISWEELSSEAGARIEIRFGELTVHVVDESGAAIAGADVRVSPLGENPPFPAVGTSDAHGEFRATLEPCECEVIAGSAGLACASEKLGLDGEHPRDVELRLRALGATDRLRGRVVTQDEKPIEGALVTANPALESSEGAMAACVQIRTGADGRFDIAIATSRELEVVAFRRDLGISDEVRFVPDGRELELVIRAQGSIDVHIAVPGGISAFSSGYVEYVLVDRHFAYVDHGHEFQVPFSLFEIPAGDYNLFVYVAGWDAYAEGSVHVAPGTNETDAPARIDLASHSAQFARGIARTSSGDPAIGAVFELDHPTWPPEVEQLWAAKVGGDGRFEAFLGEETSCATRLSRDGKLVRVELHAGDGAQLLIP